MTSLLEKISNSSFGKPIVKGVALSVLAANLAGCGVFKEDPETSIYKSPAVTQIQTEDSSAKKAVMPNISTQKNVVQLQYTSHNPSAAIQSQPSSAKNFAPAMQNYTGVKQEPQANTHVTPVKQAEVPKQTIENKVTKFISHWDSSYYNHIDTFQKPVVKGDNVYIDLSKPLEQEVTSYSNPTAYIANKSGKVFGSIKNSQAVFSKSELEKSNLLNKYNEIGIGNITYVQDGKFSDGKVSNLKDGAHMFYAASVSSYNTTPKAHVKHDTYIPKAKTAKAEKLYCEAPSVTINIFSQVPTQDQVTLAPAKEVLTTPKAPTLSQAAPTQPAAPVTEEIKSEKIISDAEKPAQTIPAQEYQITPGASAYNPCSDLELKTRDGLFWKTDAYTGNMQDTYNNKTGLYSPVEVTGDFKFEQKKGNDVYLTKIVKHGEPLEDRLTFGTYESTEKYAQTFQPVTLKEAKSTSYTGITQKVNGQNIEAYHLNGGSWFGIGHSSEQYTVGVKDQENIKNCGIIEPTRSTAASAIKTIIYAGIIGTGGYALGGGFAHGGGAPAPTGGNGGTDFGVPVDSPTFGPSTTFN